mmetsp:Transcript_10257/g.20624  ORF Transcript_10257/g.20624 Transcript_10257/m.20624 type:complete len:113 (-) Transcript_10257:102-440(-)
MVPRLRRCADRRDGTAKSTAMMTILNNAYYFQVSCEFSYVLCCGLAIVAPSVGMGDGGAARVAMEQEANIIGYFHALRKAGCTNLHSVKRLFLEREETITEMASTTDALGYR